VERDVSTASFTGPTPSDDGFLAMWEGAGGQRTGPADDANDLSTGGIAPYLPKDVRREQY
jgi:hypothetical protein